MFCVVLRVRGGEENLRFRGELRFVGVEACLEGESDFGCTSFRGLLRGVVGYGPMVEYYVW